MVYVKALLLLSDFSQLKANQTLHHNQNSLIKTGLEICFLNKHNSVFHLLKAQIDA